MARSCGGGRCTSGLEGPSPKGRRKAGEKGRREVEREQREEQGESGEQGGERGPGNREGDRRPHSPLPQ